MNTHETETNLRDGIESPAARILAVWSRLPAAIRRQLVELAG